jgi:ribonucleoside-diphosphate reductase beta chain
VEITHIIKRDSEISIFELNKITKAIEKAMLSVNNGSHKDAIAITNIVNGALLERKLNEPLYTPTVEQVQDIVELKLMDSPFHDVTYKILKHISQKRRKVL